MAIIPDLENIPASGSEVLEPRCYNIVRFYRTGGIRRRIIRERVTETEAQAHCGDPETSSSTCKGKVGRARTRKVGDWFDGYESR